MVKVGDKVRIKELPQEELADIPSWQSNPSGMEGTVTWMATAFDEYPICVEFEPGDDEDNRRFPDCYRADEMEVLPSD